jgi:hypothetical protein
MLLSFVDMTSIQLDVEDVFEERVRVVMERTGITTREEFFRLACQFFDFATEQVIENKYPIYLKKDGKLLEFGPFWLEGDRRPN